MGTSRQLAPPLPLHVFCPLIDTQAASRPRARWPTTPPRTGSPPRTPPTCSPRPRRLDGRSPDLPPLVCLPLQFLTSLDSARRPRHPPPSAVLPTTVVWPHPAKAHRLPLCLATVPSSACFGMSLGQCDVVVFLRMSMPYWAPAFAQQTTADRTDVVPCRVRRLPLQTLRQRRRSWPFWRSSVTASRTLGSPAPKTLPPAAACCYLCSGIPKWRERNPRTQNAPAQEKPQNTAAKMDQRCCRNFRRV